ncbi:DUF7935 family protein [Lutibacter sp.]
MELSEVIDVLNYTIPSIITGGVAYFFFLNYTKTEEKKLKLSILKENQKQALPIKLQAYERMTLFLERINPSKLVVRVASVNNDKDAYVQSLISTIEQEFEHNTAQQIYVSEACWSVIVAAKNATIHLITNAAKNKANSNAQELRAFILKQVIDTPSPTTSALVFIKNEVANFI